MKILTVILVILLLLTACMPKAPVSKEKVDVIFYVMSQCPYGVQVEKGIEPIFEELGENINYRVEFIAGEKDGEFQSLHGEPEVKGNIAQLCVQEKFNDDFVKFLACVNKNPANIPDNWKDCAKELELDVEALEECYTGEEGKELLRVSLKKAQDIKAQGSPTMYINDELYQGGRTAGDFKKAVCRHLVEHPSCKDLPACSSAQDCPAEKDKIPKCENPDTKEAKCVYEDAKSFDIVILSSAKCKNCDASKIAETLNQIPGAKGRTLNLEDEEGKKLVDELNIKKLPAVLFSASVKDTQFWKVQTNLPGILEDKGEWLKFPDEAVGANFFVSEEERQKLLKDAGMIQDKPVLDFFVMSYCPFGNTAEETVEKVYDLLKDKAIFRPRYVIYSNYKGGGPDFCLEDGSLCSMHGIQELNQNIREACVNENFGLDKWFEFAKAMNRECDHSNADACWEAVAQDLHLDTKLIQKCQTAKGLELIKEDKRVGDLLSVMGSPTILINGETFSNKRTPESIKQALCSVFEQKPKECDTTLESTASLPTADGSC